LLLVFVSLRLPPFDLKFLLVYTIYKKIARENFNFFISFLKSIRNIDRIIEM